MSLRLITPATALPVSLATAKQQMNLEHSEHDELITLMIRAAAANAEQQLNRALMSQTWQLLIDAFPAAEIRLARPRVQAITSIVYVNTAGADVTLNPSLYTLDADLLPGWVLPALGTTWPATREQANAVRVTFVSGYGNDAASVPPEVTQWLLQQVAAMYRNREAFAQGLTVAELPGRFVDGLLDAQRLYW